MGGNDPFGGDSDRTIMRPRPGGRGPRPAPFGGPGDGHTQQRFGQAAPAPARIVGAGMNALVAAATPLFTLVGQLRNTISYPDISNLQAHVSQEIVNFEAEAKAKGVPAETILAARYALCTLIDETVLSTPWGTESNWGNQTLLVRFHNEAWGGEKFFQILDRLLTDPARNLHLLEFMYICLALGFEGKFRVQAQGRAHLEQVQHRVYEAIRSYRGDFERTLSPHWEGVQDQRPKLARYVPFWVIGAVAAGVLLAAFVGFLFSLNKRSDPIVTDVAMLGTDAAPVVERELIVAPPSVTLTDLLERDELASRAMAEGLVKVLDEPGRSTVTLWGMFASGQARVESSQEPLLLRVGSALSELEGPVTIVGHTDNVPIRTLSFPSNWELSEQRAKSVLGVLGRAVPDRRLSAEGRADTQPLVDNDTPVNRALNRRVEVILFYQSGDL
jgi:type VI secretion system protein ImpK